MSSQDTAQRKTTLTALNVCLSVVVVLLIVCIVVLKQLRTRGYTTREHTVDAVSCDRTEVCSDGKCQRSTIKCTISGDFGELSKQYKHGKEPSPGDKVTVFTTQGGQATLTPVLDMMLGYILLVLAITLLSISLLVLAVVRLIAWILM